MELVIFIGFWRDPDAVNLILTRRFPRTVAAVLTGSSMAVAGSYSFWCGIAGTTGTTESAMLGLLLVTLFAPWMPTFYKMLVSAICALAGMGFFSLLSADCRRLPPTQPMLVPLIGLIYSGIIGAGAVFFAYQADMIQYLSVWTSGEFSGVIAGRYELLWLAGGMSVLAYFTADQISIAGLGRSMSTGFGLNYTHVMTRLVNGFYGDRFGGCDGWNGVLCRVGCA